MPDPDEAKPSGPRPAGRYLLRAWWLIVIGFFAGASLGYVATVRAPVRYEADAVVVVTGPDAATSNFANVAGVMFATDSVLQPVIDIVGLAEGPRSLLSRHQLSVQSVSGSDAVRIVGRDADANRAQALANQGAESLVTALRNSVPADLKGTTAFTAFETSLPGVRIARPVRRNAVVGGVAGALSVAAILLIVFGIRQPTVEEIQARKALGADASFTAHAKGTTGSEAASSMRVSPSGVLDAVRRAAHAAAMSPDGYRVVVIGRRREDGSIVAAIANQIARPHGETAPDPPDLSAAVIEADADSIAKDLAIARSVVVVVPYGAPGASLRRLEEELRVAPAIERRVALLVDRRR